MVEELVDGYGRGAVQGGVRGQGGQGDGGGVVELVDDVLVDDLVHFVEQELPGFGDDVADDDL